MKTLFILVAVLAAFMFSVDASAQTVTPKTSGVYLSGADYENGRLAFEGGCETKAHKLELHDVLNKPYIDVTPIPKNGGTRRMTYLDSVRATGMTIGSLPTASIGFSKRRNCTFTGTRLPCRLGRVFAWRWHITSAPGRGQTVRCVE
jgi:hypothetical protein